MEKQDKKVGYKDTLNLPKTTFSMKANLPQREPEFLKKWKQQDIYRQILKAREETGKSFILHDGPPYANGNIHVGHVLNKTLKDICTKYYSMKGYRSPFVPGWDCHGLPVEHQLLKDMKLSKHEIDKVDFRKKAYKYAMKFVKIQCEEFKRLGIFADWDNPYLTLTKDYEADILEALADLYKKGYIYKDLKPVNWCASCETALAEAEVEHEEKMSPSIYVKFPSNKKLNGKPVNFVIWTTTPWTLIANVAVALSPNFEYQMVETNGEIWIVLDSLADSIMEKCKITEFLKIGKKTGEEIVNEYKTVRHPFIDRESMLVLANYVTEEDGTGCVHTAPGHGQDDYMTGKKYGLDIIMLVNDKGVFTENAGEFANQNIFDANEKIIERMKINKTLVIAGKVKHSYPHCWRCKSPIIFRATEQWFMNVDHDDLRKKVLKAIQEEVKWVPSSGSERIFSMVEGRPDWCLSRQRFWGVPIPAFKCTDCNETFTSYEIIKKVSDYTRAEGSSAWFVKSIDEITSGKIKCQKCGKTNFKKEEDILDVWFDSGVSHKAVMEQRKELSFPADLYLEGSDQHRGWFQSSILTSVALKDIPPYKKVLTHGFVVDFEGKKMSKSLGNVIGPEEIIKKYGADILRLWVASSDYEGDIKLSSEILERLADGYRKIRNTFRFLLSNLYDFDFEKDAMAYENLAEIDKWILSRLYSLQTKVDEYYKNCEFHRVYRSVYDFCVREVSSFYLDVLKDTLYIVEPDSEKRRSPQTAMFYLMEVLSKLMAPILSFTTEEVWSNINLKNKPDSIHLALWTTNEKWKDEGLDNKWENILSLRDCVMKALEIKRGKGEIGSSLEAKLEIYSEDETLKKFLNDSVNMLPVLFKVSQVKVLSTKDESMEQIQDAPISVLVTKAEGIKCERCWNYGMATVQDGDYSDLCERCYDIIMKRRKNAEEN